MANYETMTDRELAIAGGGDQRALAALYDRHFADLYDFAARTQRNLQRAGEVVERTFAEAFRDLIPAAVPENVRARLFSIALRNMTLPAAQTPPLSQPAPSPSQRPQTAPTTAFTDVDTTISADLASIRGDADLRDLVWQSAAELSQREYALLDLSARRGMNAGELAAVFGISGDTAEATSSSVNESFDQAATASLLTHRGQAGCPELAGLLAQSTAPEDSPVVREAVSAHLRVCDRCQATLSAYPPPLTVFAGFAAVHAAAGLKEVIWGNILAAAPASTVAALEHVEPARRNRWPWIVAALLLGGIVLATLLFFLLSDGDDEVVDDPDDVRSTSHEVGEESTDPVVRMVWSRQDGVLAYSVEFSTIEFELPDEEGDLSGDATDAESTELDPGEWYFHLRTQRADGSWTDTVHVGPFVIVAEEPTPTEEPEPTEEPTETAAPETPTPQPATLPPTPVPTTPTPAPATLTPTP
jgi:DNA-directed RNA polymerase specialized sigma24 family protein